jgi:hypothetical protein
LVLDEERALILAVTWWMEMISMDFQGFSLMLKMNVYWNSVDLFGICIFMNKHLNLIKKAFM